MKRNPSTLSEFLNDLRSSLIGIRGFSSTLLDGTDQDVYDKEERKEFLGIVVSECERLRLQLDALLGTSRIGMEPWLAPNYSRFDLLMVLKEHVRLQERASLRHTVSLDVHNRLPETIIADQDRFHQILMNLLSNAIKYSPNGGEVTLHARTEGEDILVGVQDQGIGLSKEDLRDCLKLVLL
ncbi:MAG: sensor histidine kinase [Fimbriimonas sp.]